MLRLNRSTNSAHAVVPAAWIVSEPAYMVHTNAGLHCVLMCHKSSSDGHDHYARLHSL